MKVKCIHDKVTGDEWFQVPYGWPKGTRFGFLEVNKEYLVMGMFKGEGDLYCLIDDYGSIISYPIQLFEVVDSKIPDDWHFRMYTKQDPLYPYREAVWGYYELCFNDDHYDKLVDQDDEAQAIYFRVKFSD